MGCFKCLTVVILLLFNSCSTQVILNEDLIVNFNNVTLYCDEMVELRCHYVVDIDITGPIFLDCPKWLPYNVTTCVIMLRPTEKQKVTCKAGHIEKSTKFIERCNGKRQTTWSTISKALPLSTLYLVGLLTR